MRSDVPRSRSRVSSRAVRAATAPLARVSRSRCASWNTMATLSRLACRSISMPYPAAMAAAIAALRIFLAPRAHAARDARWGGARNSGGRSGNLEYALDFHGHAKR